MQPHEPDWVSLPVAVEALTKCGRTEEDAKLLICKHLSQRTLHFRAKFEGAGQFMSGDDIDIPSYLFVSDFDWANSRPFVPWRPTPDGVFNLWRGRSVPITERVERVEVRLANLKEIDTHSTTERPTNIKQRRRPGPKPGDAAPLAAADRALFAEIEQLMDGGKTLHGAAVDLALLGRVAGTGEPVNLARRLERRFAQERQRRSDPIQLDPTRSN